MPFHTEANDAHPRFPDRRRTLTAAAFAGENWPQFRGPHDDGLSDSNGLPLTWSEKENVVWKTPIHDKGWSSPVVWGDQVWMTTATADGKQMFAVCVDRKTGAIRPRPQTFRVREAGAAQQPDQHLRLADAGH